MGFRRDVLARSWLLAIALAAALLVACGGGGGEEEAAPKGTEAPGATPSATRAPPPLTISSISPNPASVGGEVTITFKTDPRAVIGFQVTDSQGKIVAQAMVVADTEGTATYKQAIAGPPGAWRVQAAAGRSSGDLMALQASQSSPAASGSPSTGAISIEGNYGSQAASGATGTKTATASNDADAGNAHILALRPASAPNPSTISFRAAAAAAGTSAGSLSLTIDKPSGTVAGDVMIASIALRPNTATVTAPAGWKLVRRIDNGNPNANSLAVYYKVAGGSEPANYAWTFSTPTSAPGGIQTFTGVDTTSPINAENGQAAPKALSHTTPSVTTTVANTMIVTSHAFASAAAWAPPSGMTEAFEAAGQSVPQPGSASARFEVQ